MKEARVIKKNNLSVNAVLNALKSFLYVVFPLITYPYITRVLGSENVGKVSFAYSVVEYFQLFAVFGMLTYGVREGAKRKDDPAEFSRFTNEVTTINLIMMLIAYAAFFLLITFVDVFSGYRALLLLTGSSIFMYSFALDWVNIVYDNYLFLTLRLLFSYVIMTVALFCLVKAPEDYYIYTLITLFPIAVLFVSNNIYTRRKTKITFTRHPNFKQHFKPMSILFVNAIAVSVFVNFDITMLGWIKNDVSVGLYSVSGKIYNVVKNVLTAVYSVAIARLVVLYNEKKTDEFKKTYSDIICVITMLLIPAGIGLALLAKEVMYIVGGDEFVQASNALVVLAFALILSIWNGLITSVLNICIGKEKDNLIATLLGTLLNIGLNIFFIARWDYVGAAITTLLAEVFVFVFCLSRTKNPSQYFDMPAILKSVADAVVGSVMIVIIAFAVKTFVANYILRILFIVPLSCAAYLFYLIFIRKNSYVLGVLQKMSRKGK